jgi:hypothetical protein
MFRQVAGRPVLPRMDHAAQRRRRMSQLQRRIVSGVTSSRSAWRRAFGITLSSVASRAQSVQVGVRATRLPPLQDSELVAQDQDLCGLPSLLTPDSRSDVVTRVMRRKVNRRHMTGDHHGRGAGRATLLVRAADAILGTEGMHRDLERYRAPPLRP